MKNDEEQITIQDLYPDLTPEQQEEAEYNLEGYVDLIRRIYDRIEAEGKLDELAETLTRDKRLNNTIEAKTKE